MIPHRVLKFALGWLLLCVPLQAQTGARGALEGPAPGPPRPAQAFVNFESPHVHPLDLDGTYRQLLAVNTADNRVELFDISGVDVRWSASIPVGLDPVSVRFRNQAEAWVVNHISDSVSVIDLASQSVVRTLATDDEPADVVFAGPQFRWGFVTCSQANTVLRFDATDLDSPPVRIPILGEDPRALAVSKNGQFVYAAIAESGNRTTLLAGGSTEGGTFPGNAVSHTSGPYGGLNPPPNAGTSIQPPMNAALPPAPAVGLIIKQQLDGSWQDENGADWTLLTSGLLSRFSGRPIGWTLLDNDVAKIRVTDLSVTYYEGLMNAVMALGVNPQTGVLTVVGTDAINHVRYEPNLNGIFGRMIGAHVPPSGSDATLFDLNPHLDYTRSIAPQGVRDIALGDPRGVAWDRLGVRAFVTGMGSNNVVVLDSSGARSGLSSTIEVGEGPTGIVVQPPKNRLFTLNRFEGTISIVDTGSELEVGRVPFHDPTPSSIRRGRRHLYDTHTTSGLGHLSCGSCHIDARMDRLSWDLGDPTGDMKSVQGQNLGAGNTAISIGIADFHPMKGPMLTQTLQDIVGKEPHHWRGDKDGLEEFNGAFTGLLGDDEQLTPQEMQEFESFLASLYYPPNPFRNLDNTLPQSLDLTGHYATGKFGPEGAPLGTGDARNGLALFMGPNGIVGGQFDCIECHTSPTGMGPDMEQVGGVMQSIPAGPLGERHHALTGTDGSTNTTMKIPHLRNLYERTGLEMTQVVNQAGFGFFHDGSVDSIARFLSKPSFGLTSDQDVADMTAFLLSYSGGDLPLGDASTPTMPPGPPSQDVPAGVGRQITLRSWANPDPAQIAILTKMFALADDGQVGLVAHANLGGIPRGFAYTGGGFFQTDRRVEKGPVLDLLASAAPGTEVTVTLVPWGSQTRIGLDRDGDGYYDRDEIDQGFDPGDPLSNPLALWIPTLPWSGL